MGHEYYGRGYSYSPPHHQQQQQPHMYYSSSSHPHHHHHTHPHHHHAQRQGANHSAYAYGRSGGHSPVAGSSVISSDTYSEYDSKTRMRWLLSVGLLLPALAALIGVVAWAVSAEVVMGARRESALRASEAFRFSQQAPPTSDLDWRAVETHTQPPIDDMDNNAVSGHHLSTPPKVLLLKEKGKEDSHPMKDDEGVLSAWEEKNMVKSVSQNSPTGSSVKDSATLKQLSPMTTTRKPMTLSTKTTTTTLSPPRTVSDEAEDEGDEEDYDDAPTTSSSSTTTTTTTTTTKKPVAVNGNNKNKVPSSSPPPIVAVAGGTTGSSLGKILHKDVLSSSSPRLNGGNASSIFFLNGVDTFSKPEEGKKQQQQTGKSPGDQVAEVINRLVAQRNMNGVRPHIVVVAPSMSDSKKSKSPVTTTTSKPLLKKPTSSSSTGGRITSSTSKKASDDSPTTAKPILSKDADTLLAAAHMLAARRKFISMRADENEDEEEEDEDDDEPMMDKKNDEVITTPPSSSTSLKPIIQTQSSIPQIQSSPSGMHLITPQSTHPSINRQVQIPPPQMVFTRTGIPPVIPHHHQATHLTQTFVTTGRQPDNRVVGPPAMAASHFVPTHVLPPNHHPHIHHHPRMIPQQQGSLSQQQLFRGQPVNSAHHIISTQHSPPFVNPSLPGFNQQIRYVSGSHPQHPYVLPSGPLPHIVHPNQALHMPHPLPFPPPPMNVPPTPPSPASPQNTDGEETTEPTDESQVSMQYPAESNNNKNKAVIQFHTPDAQTAESGASKGLTLHFGGGPVGGGTQLMTSPVGIFKTLLLPLLPKPRMNLNGKVVFGVVLEKSAGFGKQKHSPPRLVKFHPTQLYRP